MLLLARFPFMVPPALFVHAALRLTIAITIVSLMFLFDFMIDTL